MSWFQAAQELMVELEADRRARYERLGVRRSSRRRRHSEKARAILLDNTRACCAKEEYAVYMLFRHYD
jgi:hypothetical protein